MSRRGRDRGECLRRAGGSKKKDAPGKEAAWKGKMATGSRLENWLKKHGKRGGMRVGQKIG